MVNACNIRSILEAEAEISQVQTNLGLDYYKEIKLFFRGFLIQLHPNVCEVLGPLPRTMKEKFITKWKS